MTPSKVMITELLDSGILAELTHHIHWVYAVLIVFGTEALKLLTIKEDGKTYFKFDTEKVLKFNIRIPILLLSFLYGLAIVIIEQDTDIIFSLFVTFCVANVAYDYVGKRVRKLILE